VADDTERVCYILFENVTQALVVNELLKASGVRATIVPTPRSLSVSCGMALALSPSEEERARAAIKRANAAIADIACITRDINPRRDKYC
jgi:hypothetical protein